MVFFLVQVSLAAVAVKVSRGERGYCVFLMQIFFAAVAMRDVFHAGNSVKMGFC